MLAEALRLVLAVLLLAVLPGWLLVTALFPPGRPGPTRLERAYLAPAAGLLLLALVGVTLGLLLPHGQRGWFSTYATGFPHVEVAMLLVSGGLFYVGLVRGAYPRVAARFPQLLEPVPPPAERQDSR